MDKNYIKPVVGYSFLAGLVTAIVSLAASAVFSSQQISSENPVWVSFFVLLEETAKLVGLIVFFSTSSYFDEKINALIGGAFFGTGFGIFEILLVKMQGITFHPTVLLVVLVHIVTAFVLAASVHQFSKGTKKWISYSLGLLAITLHLCYNLVVLQSIVS